MVAFSTAYYSCLKFRTVVADDLQLFSFGVLFAGVTLEVFDFSIAHTTLQANLEVTIRAWANHARILTRVTVTALELGKIKLQQVVVCTFNFLFIDAGVAYIISASVFSTSPHAFLFRLTAEHAVVSLSISREGTEVPIVYADRFVVHILFATVFADVKITLLTAKEIQLLRALFSLAPPLANITPKTDWVLKQSPSKILNDMALVVFCYDSGSNF